MNISLDGYSELKTQLYHVQVSNFQEETIKLDLQYDTQLLEADWQNLASFHYDYNKVDDSFYWITVI